MSDEDLEQDELEASDEDEGEELAAAEDSDDGDSDSDSESPASGGKSKGKKAAVEVEELPSIEAKQKERDALARAMEDFLARGGKVQEVEPNSGCRPAQEAGQQVRQPPHLRLAVT